MKVITCKLQSIRRKITVPDVGNIIYRMHLNKRHHITIQVISSFHTFHIFREFKLN